MLIGDLCLMCLISDKDDQIKWLREELKYHEAELEALQQFKSCDGCKYEHKDAYSLPCAACVRNCDSDYYVPKEQ